MAFSISTRIRDLTLASLSEYGCIKSTRHFEEVSALYNTEMTGVYSGGLVYQYSEEGDGYGLVTISGSTVTEKSDFTALQSALAANPVPSGDGGAKTSGSASTCPPASDSWDISPWSGSALPAIPSGAQQYMTKGAGKGPGLTGDGSQNAPGGSTVTASAGSGSVTAVASNTASTASTASSSSSSTAKSAASALVAGDLGVGPFVCAAVVLVSTAFGTLLI